ncbi:MAG: hypothetical protein ACKO4Q_08165 [Planctomycetota bacterium]
MAERVELERECDVLARYLGASAGDEYVRAQYRAAHDAGVVELPGTSSFERTVVAVARHVPVLSRPLDAHARVFAPSSLLRRKLVLLLAILEVRAPHDEELDTPTGSSVLAMFARMAWLGLVFLAALFLGSLLSVPIWLISLAGGAR